MSITGKIGTRNLPMDPLGGPMYIFYRVIRFVRSGAGSLSYVINRCIEGSNEFDRPAPVR